ncbi:MAG: DUF1553 domain-containing protein [Verrucomicrobia bacterium]|nr:DUF1553 domain-containing protein [Verrucomicrobiota bacterium]
MTPARGIRADVSQGWRRTIRMTRVIIALLAALSALLGTEPGGVIAASTEVSADTDGRTHWSFSPRARPPVPAVRRLRWVRNPIDAFIAQQQESRGLTPQPEARRETLYRRLYFDLLGVPPSLEDLARLEADRSPGWYERAVERLLEDSRYGERWGRHWMDIWRYSDWWGLGDQLRNSQKHIWHWRDWIVESVNNDLPYDEMIREMLAADELYPEDLKKLRATGFLARDYFLFNRHQWMEEVVEHVGKGFLGLTFNCAKCHDHKYDPILQTDFYRMRAFFEPYHVRLDAVPGEQDLARDGIPRVYDGLLETPTYRFVRGNENNPDKSTLIVPAVPDFLGLRMSEVQSIELPRSAWQPERRPWALESYRSNARRSADKAASKLAQARARITLGATNQQERAELAAIEAASRLANADLESVERRIEAMRAAWARTDAGPACSDCERKERDASRVAAQAERQAAVAKAAHAVCEIELTQTRAAADKKDGIGKELKSALEALEKAKAAAAAPPSPKDSYVKLTGAQWTPTRFLSSTADDPVVAFPPRSSGRRKALAEWIADARNPLTARVAANHVWARHMGVPLVPTVFEFGRKGTPPTHPELLDWLACELVDSGWSMKHLQRLIVTSSVYRMSSSTLGAEADMAKDPDNRWWWRRSPIRLEAQSVRDALLAHAGELDLTMGGPPIPQNQQADSKRRSLYFFHSNNDQNLFLSLFDNASVKECYRRNESIVPQQALALTNSRLVQDSSIAIAKRLAAEGRVGASRTSDAAFLRQAFSVLLGMNPSPAELAASDNALQAWRASEKDPAGQDAPTAARARLVWALINHNDFLTLR